MSCADREHGMAWQGGAGVRRELAYNDGVNGCSSGATALAHPGALLQARDDPEEHVDVEEKDEVDKEQRVVQAQALPPLQRGHVGPQRAQHLVPGLAQVQVQREGQRPLGGVGYDHLRGSAASDHAADDHAGARPQRAILRPAVSTHKGPGGGSMGKMLYAHLLRQEHGR